jgi:chitinase
MGRQEVGQRSNKGMIILQSWIGINLWTSRSAFEKTKMEKDWTLCCADGTMVGNCQWRGGRGLGMPCFSGCEIDETELIQSTRYLLDMKSGELDCSGNTYASFCCSAFSAPPGGVSSEVDSNPDSEESDDDDDPIMAKFGDRAKAIAEAGAEKVGLDIAAKSLCTLIVTGIEALLDGAELAVPFFGMSSFLFFFY